ncbi:hypothetical protein [Clostridium sp. Ade.TY]|uniref:hypothetical protein n=1 Tax=Clostridium sp. Ade.TY TaxID=1391647 RepID=UPI000426C631|nr:hypothetical protein [Clostridium sp. Ade.TY]
MIITGCNFKFNNLGKKEFDVGIYNEELTEREKLFLSIGNDKSIVFKYNLKDQFNKIIIWSEKYKKGNLILNDIGRTEVLINDSGLVVITLSDPITSDTDKCIANIFIGNEIEYSKTKFPYRIEENSLSDIMKVFSVNSFKDNSIKDENILGYIGYSKGDVIETISEEFYKNNDISLLKDYDSAYIIKCKFVKE